MKTIIKTATVASLVLATAGLMLAGIFYFARPVNKKTGIDTSVKLEKLEQNNTATSTPDASGTTTSESKINSIATAATTITEEKTTNSNLNEERALALKTAKESGAQVVKENEKSYEIIDKPLPKWNFPKKYYGKMIEFTIKSGESAGQKYTVILDPQTGTYKETMSISDGFYLVNSNGIVCYGRPAYKNAYCVREKYSPLAIARYYLGQKNLGVRQFSDDEEELSSLMNDYGWLPDNILAAMMSSAEIAFSQLAEDKLAKGTVLAWESEDGKDKNVIGTVESINFDKPMENIKIGGIHLTYLMADIYNAMYDPGVSNKQSETLGFPYVDMENGNNDDNLENFFSASGFKKENYFISQ